MITLKRNQIARAFQAVTVSVALLVIYTNATQVRAYQQSPSVQKDVEIMQLKARIAELENQQVGCLEPRRDPTLNEPVWAGR